MVRKRIPDIILPVRRIKKLSYIYNETEPTHWIVLTRKPFCGILIYPSGNLNHPRHASLTYSDYHRWVAPTLTDLPVTATAPFMIVAHKIPLSLFQYACHYHLRFRQQPESQFFNKFYFVNVFKYLTDKTCFWFMTGERIFNSWIIQNQIYFHFVSNDFPYWIKLFFFRIKNRFELRFEF